MGFRREPLQRGTSLLCRWVEPPAHLDSTRTTPRTLHTPQCSALRDAFYGNLLGLRLFWWFPPAWFLGGWLGAAGGGALIGEAMKRSGVEERFVDEVKSVLTPDTSALFLIADKSDVDEMERELALLQPFRVIRHTPVEATVENLRREMGPRHGD